MISERQQDLLNQYPTLVQSEEVDEDFLYKYGETKLTIDYKNCISISTPPWLIFYPTEGSEKMVLVYADYHEMVFEFATLERWSVGAKTSHNSKGVWCKTLISGYIPESLEKDREKINAMMAFAFMKKSTPEVREE